MPFEQAVGGLNRPYEGVGLGLPLAQKLTELQGGKLHIDSVLEQGTTVSLTFPAHRTIRK